MQPNKSKSVNKVRERFEKGIKRSFIQAVCQSVRLSHPDGVKQSTLQQPRQSLLISVIQISAAVWLFAACCHSLSKTQQLPFLGTAEVADSETAKADAVWSSSIKPRCLAFLGYLMLSESYTKMNSSNEF